MTYFKKSGLALLLIPFFFACDDPSELGLEVDSENTNVKVAFIDIILPVSTIYIDSLRTEDQNNILFGSFEDSISGKVSATGYTMYNQDLNSTNDLPNIADVFHSLSLVLSVSDFKSDDIAVNQSISIHLAKDTLFKEGIYLSNRFTDYDPEPIGELTFDFNPAIDTVLTIPLDSLFGEFLFDRLKRTNLDSASLDSLLLSLYHFDPLVIVPGENNNSLFSLDLREDTTGIYVNFDNESGILSTYRFDMLVGRSTEAHYTHLSRDIGNSKLSTLMEDYDAIDNISRSYLNPLSGVYPKIDLEPLTTFVSQNTDIIINRSDLTLPYSNIDLGYIEPVDFIYFFFIQDNDKINATGTLTGNAIDKSLLTEGSYLSSSEQTFITFTKDEDNLSYTGSTTFFTQIFVDNVLNGTDFLTQEMVVMAPRTMGLGQTSFINNEIKLRIYYTSLK